LFLSDQILNLLLLQSFVEEEADKISEGNKRQPRQRTGSFFEGASKYDILLYLRDAKDRIGYTDFEIDLEQVSYYKQK